MSNLLQCVFYRKLLYDTTYMIPRGGVGPGKAAREKVFHATLLNDRIICSSSFNIFFHFRFL